MPYTHAAHVQADEAASWTSKYLRGNEGLRELVNTLLELAYVAPHRRAEWGGRYRVVVARASFA